MPHKQKGLTRAQLLAIGARDADNWHRRAPDSEWWMVSDGPRRKKPKTRRLSGCAEIPADPSELRCDCGRVLPIVVTRGDNGPAYRIGPHVCAPAPVQHPDGIEPHPIVDRAPGLKTLLRLAHPPGRLAPGLPLRK